MDVKALMTRKVAGVPVIYIAGLFVAILAVVAWKMKPAAEPSRGRGRWAGYHGGRGRRRSGRRGLLLAGHSGHGHGKRRLGRDD
jgi:hypothetical protein